MRSGILPGCKRRPSGSAPSAQRADSENVHVPCVECGDQGFRHGQGTMATPIRKPAARICRRLPRRWFRHTHCSAICWHAILRPHRPDVPPYTAVIHPGGAPEWLVGRWLESLQKEAEEKETPEKIKTRPPVVGQIGEDIKRLEGRSSATAEELISLATRTFVGPTSRRRTMGMWAPEAGIESPGRRLRVTLRRRPTECRAAWARRSERREPHRLRVLRRLHQSLRTLR